MSDSAFLTVYNASAGSGKTTTLIREILNIILCLNENTLNIKKIRQILGLTFTNAVANELKKRLIDVLYNLAFSENGIDNNKKYFKDASLQDTPKIKERAKQVLSYILHNYSDVSLQTIDSFSNRLLKSFAYELNYSIAYEISTNEDYYFSKSMDIFLDTITSNNNQNFQIIKQYVLNKKKEGKETYKADHLFNEILNTLKPLIQKESGREATDKMQEHINKINEFNIKKIYDKYTNILNNKIIKFNTDIKESLKKHLEIDIINNSVSKNNEWINGQQIGRLNRLYTNAFENYQSDFIDFISQDKKYSKKNYEDKNTKLVADLYAMQSEYITLFHLHTQLNLIRTLLNKFTVTKFSLLLIDKLNQLKTEDDVVFFSDFTKEISKVIQSETNVDFIFEKVGVRYRNFLIDEFQDTSTLQFNNLLPLIHNSMAEGQSNFIVGDPKQSIYRWRNANVQQFLDLYLNKEISFEKIKDDWEKFKDKIDTKTLNENYRSARDIVEFNNLIFHQLEFNQIHLIKDVYKNAQQIPKNDSTGYIEITEYTCTDEFSNKNNRFVQFAEDVFKVIDQNIRCGYQQKDICILLRTNQNIKDIIHLLHKKKLSNNETLEFISPEGQLIYLSPDVEFIIHFLQLLLNKDNQMSSGICWNYEKKYHYKYADEFGTNFFTEKMKDDTFKKIFANYSINHQDLYHLCLNIISYFKISQDKYIQKFLNIVNKFTHQYALQGNTIQDFLDFWEKYKTKFTIHSGKEQNAVQLMSIHKSKGLEFPVVITYLNFDHNPGNYWYCIPDNYTIPLTIDNETTKINDFQNNYFYLNVNDINNIDANTASQLISEEHLENINLIYVAFTRAISKLYIFADEKNIYYKNIIFPKIENKVIQKQTNEANSSENDENKKHILIKKYTLGNNELVTIKKSEMSTHVIDIEHSIKLSNNQNILLANNSYSHSDEVETGLKIHKVLENMKDNNIEYAINKSLAKGLIRYSQKEPIQKMLNLLLNHPSIGFYFSNIKHVLNEPDIFSCKENTESAIYRPDKVLFTNDNQIVVLEFKTGEKKSQHKTQIKNYIQLLHNLYQNSFIKGFLIYIYANNVEVIEINLSKI